MKQYIYLDLYNFELVTTSYKLDASDSHFATTISNEYHYIGEL